MASMPDGAVVCCLLPERKSRGNNSPDRRKCKVHTELRRGDQLPGQRQGGLQEEVSPARSWVSIAVLQAGRRGRHWKQWDQHRQVSGDVGA